MEPIDEDAELADEQVVEEEDEEARKIEEAHKVWERNAFLMYDVAFSKNLEWPALTVEWLPGTVTDGAAEGWNRHQALVGTHTDGAPNRLMIVSVELPAEDTAVDTRENFGKDCSTVAMELDHPGGEVNRARYMPQQPTKFATQCANGKVYVYDLERAADDESPNPGPVVVCDGHTEEGFGLSWNPRKSGELVSAANDGLLCLWDVAETEAKAVNVIRDAHNGPIGDVTFSPRASQFASVGDDKRILLWDLRSATAPASIVAAAHDDDITSVAFPPIFDDESPYVQHFFATGSADTTVKLWDQRFLRSPLHVNKHDAAIVTVEWAPFAENVLAAAGEDRKVHVYDYSKIGAPQKKAAAPAPAPADDDEDDRNPPELVMSHSGHKAKITDFSWSPNEEFLAASVDVDNAFQVWWVTNDVYVDDGEDPAFSDYHFFEAREAANPDTAAPAAANSQEDPAQDEPDAKKRKTDP